MSTGCVLALMSDGPRFLARRGESLPWASAQDLGSVATLGVLTAMSELATGPQELSTVVARVAAAVGEDPDTLGAALDQLEHDGLLTASTARVSAASSGALAPAADGPLPTERLLLATPWLLRLGGGGYESLGHDGELQLTLDPVELYAASLFARATTVSEVQEAVPGLDQQRFERLAGALLGLGRLFEFDPDDPEHMGAQGRAERDLRRSMARAHRHRREIDRRAAEHADAEEERQQRTGVTRLRVIPAGNVFATPLSLGTVISYASAFEGGRLAETYDFFPHWCNTDEVVAELSDRPGIFLFSNYIWNHNGNIDLSAAVKRHDETSITIHGGPDTPGRPADIERHLRAHPHVDIVVRGEGEQSFAELLAALEPHVGDWPVDLGCLEGVAGISYRTEEGVRHGPDRERLTDLDVVPSPYLSGLFDSMSASKAISIGIVETNRGCPYGCTFCDWGSATNSRIRKFDLDRVFAEMEWCAKAEIPFLYLADANFGIFARDVDVARKAAELKATYGYPKRFTSNFAKNTVKHVKEIIEIINDAGIVTEGLLSLQSMDQGTLDAIHRHNIKTERYEDLAVQFRHSGLPLYVDLMMGLPGQTFRSFVADVQQCIDREVTGKIFGTEMLINSPMNDPEYRAEHGLVLSREPGPTETTGDRARLNAFVVESATFTRDEYVAMNRLRRAFFLAENLGVLRQVSRFVRHETGLTETGLLEGLLRCSMDDPERWPTISLTLLTVPDVLTPPVSWQLLIDELSDYLTTQLGMPPSSALDTVLTVQHAVLPAHGRSFPHRVQLEHDYASWHRAMIEAKDEGHVHDWPDHVPPLASYGPGELEVNDPHGVCRLALGYSVELDAYTSLELQSAVARAMPTSFASND